MPRPKSKKIDLPASTQRLQEIVDESGLTIAQFAERIGMTPSGFGGVFLRGAEVSGLQARAVELEFGISYRWILTGELSRYHTLNNTKKNQNHQLVKDLEKITKQIEEAKEAQKILRTKLSSLIALQQDLCEVREKAA